MIDRPRPHVVGLVKLVREVEATPMATLDDVRRLVRAYERERSRKAWRGIAIALFMLALGIFGMLAPLWFS